MIFQNKEKALGDRHGCPQMPIMVDDKDIGSAMDVRVALLDCEVGQTISLTVDRNGERITKEIKLGKWPDDF